MTIRKIMKINQYIEQELYTRFDVYDLTINQAELLIYFYKYSSNSISATNAQTNLGMDKRLMSLALKSLEAKGYINRHPNEIDKRQKDIELSLSALEICEDLIAIFDEVNILFEANCTVDQIHALNTLTLEGDDNEE